MSFRFERLSYCGYNEVLLPVTRRRTSSSELRITRVANVYTYIARRALLFEAGAYLLQNFSHDYLRLAPDVHQGFQASPEFVSHLSRAWAIRKVLDLSAKRFFIDLSGFYP
jgi:hypothetical protein